MRARDKLYIERQNKAIISAAAAAGEEAFFAGKDLDDNPHNHFAPGNTEQIPFEVKQRSQQCRVSWIRGFLEKSAKYIYNINMYEKDIDHE